MPSYIYVCVCVGGGLTYILYVGKYGNHRGPMFEATYTSYIIEGDLL